MSRRVSSLPSDVEDVLRRRGGVFLMADARAAGIGHNRINRLVKGGTLVALVRGCYASAARIAALDAWELHREKARAFALASGLECFVTGWAAAVYWKLRTAGRVPRLPTMIVLPQHGRGRGSTTVHGKTVLADVPDQHLRIIRPAPRAPGWGIVTPAWAAVEIGRSAPTPDALIVADSAVRAGADLVSAVANMGGWDRVARARWVAEHADPNSGSALETLGRFACIQFDLPMPVSNAWVGVDGPEERLDHLWPYHWVAGEGDGALKYNDRADAAKIVHAQSDREFRLRRLGLDLVRYGWTDAYYRRSMLADRIAAVLRDNPPRNEPIRWWRDVPGGRPVEPGPDDWPSPHPLGIVLPAGWSRPAFVPS